MSLTYYKRYRMEARSRLSGEPRLPPGYRMVPWSVEAAEQHIETLHASFAGELDATVFECLGRLEGCRQLMGKITGDLGFLPEATWLIEYVAGPPSSPTKREPCGTIQGVRVTPRLGAIKNVGVTPLHRGRGLGTALVNAALHGFAEVGLSKVYLEATAENRPAVEMYRRLGFRRTRTLYKGVDSSMNERPPQENQATLAPSATTTPASETAHA